MKLQRSLSLVSVLLFLACVALVLLAQAQDGNEPNKCNTDWDFCNSGTEAENEYYWRLGWCAAAIERGAVSASPSACMGQEEGTVSFPPSSRRRAAASGTTLLQEDVPIDPDGNACHDWGDLCDSGTEAENEYHWRLGWCVWAVGTGTVLGSVSACMGEPEGTVSHPPWSPHPEGTPEPSPPNHGGGPPSSPNPDGGPPSQPNPEGTHEPKPWPPPKPDDRPRWQNQPPIPSGHVCLERSSDGKVCWLIGPPLPPGHYCNGKRGVFNQWGEFIWNLCHRWAYEGTQEP